MTRAELLWAFELPEDSTVLRMGRNESHVVLLDDASNLWVLEAESGKLQWKAPLQLDGPRSRAAPRAFSEAPQPATLGTNSGLSASEIEFPPDLIVSGDRFFLARREEVVAFSIAEGTLLWSAVLGGDRERTESASDKGEETPSIRLALGSEHLVALDRKSGTLHALLPDSGKLAWSLPTGGDGDKSSIHQKSIPPLHAGLSVSGRIAFVYDRNSVIVDLDTGRIVWRLGEEPSATFPLVLRPFREGEEAGSSEPIEAAHLPVPAEEAVVFPNGTLTTSAAVYDFLSAPSGTPWFAESFLESPASLVTPGQHWTKTRLAENTPALGVLSPNTLWLMQGDRVRRISSHLPVASRELKASGAFLGRIRNHAWFLDGSSLVHSDFTSDRVTRLSLHDLGNPEAIRVTLSGNLILVRGMGSIKLVNGLNGQVIGQTRLPEAVSEYLAGFPGEGLPPQDTSTPVPGSVSGGSLVWQGRVLRNRLHSPGTVVPVSDLLWGEQFTTLFGKRLVVCLSSSVEGEPLPPAPDLR